MTAPNSADRVVVSVTATDSGNWQVVSIPTGFQGIVSTLFAENDYIHGFVRHEDGEQWEVYDFDDDDGALLQVTSISGTVTLARPATPSHSSKSDGSRMDAGSGTHTLTITLGSDSLKRLFRETSPFWKTLTSGDATPSVADYRWLKTNGTTPITRFDDIKNGQGFWVRRGNADIVIQHDGTNIDLFGAANLTLTPASPSVYFAVEAGVAKQMAGYVAPLDEDDFASDSANMPPSQQSTKAYIAAQIEDSIADGTTTKAPSQNAVHDALIGKSALCADRTALKALDTTKEGVATLQEAGRTGVFVWRSGNYSTQIAADTLEGVYIKATAVAAASGAWVRLYNGPVYASWFGFNGTSDQTAINAALALFDSVIVDSNVTLSGKITITRDRQSVRGLGKGVTKITASSADQPIFEVAANLNYIDIGDFTLDRSTPATSGGDGVKILGYTQLAKIEDLHIFNQRRGLNLGPTSYSIIQNVFVDNCYDDNIYATGTTSGGLVQIAALQWQMRGILSQRSEGYSINFETAENSAALTLTGSLSTSATSATLASPFTGITDSHTITFSNGDVRTGTLTNGSTAVTWTTGLTGSATSSITVSRVLNTSMGDWHDVSSYGSKLGDVRFKGRAVNKMQAIRWSGGFVGESGSHGVLVDTYNSSPHKFVSVTAELAGIGSCGRNNSTPATGVGNGFNITANNTHVFLDACETLFNSYSGVISSAAYLTITGGVNILNGYAGASGETSGIYIAAGRAKLVGLASQAQNFGVYLVADGGHIVEACDLGDNAIAPFASAASLPNSVIRNNVPKQSDVLYTFLTADQAIANNTFVKVTLNNEIYDSQASFDPSTNYRWTPNKSGHYHTTAQVTLATGTVATAYTAAARITFNGTVLVQNQITVPITTDATAVTSIPINAPPILMNGTTDYLEVEVYQQSGGDIDAKGGSHLTFFGGQLIN